MKFEYFFRKVVYQIYIHTKVSDSNYILRINLKVVLSMYLGSVSGVNLRRKLELWVIVVIGSLPSGLSKIKFQEVKWLEHTIGEWQRDKEHMYTT